MITGNEDMEATALREQGWSISAIARHLGIHRETVRNHLNGTRVAGVRRRAEPDPFEEFVPTFGCVSKRTPTSGERPVRRGGGPRIPALLSELHEGDPRT